MALKTKHDQRSELKWERSYMVVSKNKNFQTDQFEIFQKQNYNKVLIFVVPEKNGSAEIVGRGLKLTNGKGKSYFVLSSYIKHLLT